MRNEEILIPFLFAIIFIRYKTGKDESSYNEVGEG